MHCIIIYTVYNTHTLSSISPSSPKVHHKYQITQIKLKSNVDGNCVYVLQSLSHIELL